jgi:protein gp37
MTTIETPVALTDGTKISWAHYTWNPWWGCARVSPACQSCYAETFSHRLGKNLWGKTADRQPASDSYWTKPLKWNRLAERDGVRRQVFCASMADVFEARDDLDVPRARLWDLIEQTPHLDWMLLTKRAEHIARLLPARWTTGGIPRNVWPGVTAEDQQRLDERLPYLLDVPAPVRFISYEPAVGPLDLDPTGLGLVICGGESGHKARPMHPDWARAVRDRCGEAGVAFHFKQWGQWAPVEQVPDAAMTRLARAVAWPDEQAMVPVGLKAAGRVLDGRVWDQMPAWADGSAA